MKQDVKKQLRTCIDKSGKNLNIQRSQETGDIVIETQNEENPCDARHTASVRTDNPGALNRNQHQQRYRKQHTEKFKKCEAERKKIQQNILLQPTTSCSDFDSIEQAPDKEHYRVNVDMKGVLKKARQRKYWELHRQELNQRRALQRKRIQNVLLQPTTSCSDFDSIEQAPDIKHYRKNVDMKTALKKERQRRYRERHREELKQREAERRKRQQNVQLSANDSKSDIIQPHFNRDQDNTQYLAIIPSIIVNDMTEGYGYIHSHNAHSSSMLTIPLIKCDDQVSSTIIKKEIIDDINYNYDCQPLELRNIKQEIIFETNHNDDSQSLLLGTIKQEIIDETDYNTDSQLLHDGTICETIDTKIKIEKDIINGYAFEGIVKSESHCLELITSVNLDNGYNLRKRSNLKSNLTRNVNMQTVENLYQCDVCHKEFIAKTDLRKHVMIHIIREKPYACSVCHKAFKSLVNLQYHNMMNHIEENPNSCNVCKKTFAKSSGLKKHMIIHVVKKPYKCSFCDKKFVKVDHFKLHSVTHAGKKPKKCDVCNKIFKSYNGLIVHIMKIHTGEKPYKCEKCDYRNARPWAIVVHNRCHTGEKPYKCDICNKTFVASSPLASHKKKHKGEKPYKCGICSQRYCLKENLNIHMAKHTGLKPHRCNFCCKAFAVKKILNSHMKTHKSSD